MHTINRMARRKGKSLLAIVLALSFLLPFVGYTGVDFTDLFSLPTHASESTDATQETTPQAQSSYEGIVVDGSMTQIAAASSKQTYFVKDSDGAYYSFTYLGVTHKVRKFTYTTINNSSTSGDAKLLNGYCVQPMIQASGIVPGNFFGNGYEAHDITTETLTFWNNGSYSTTYQGKKYTVTMTDAKKEAVLLVTGLSSTDDMDLSAFFPNGNAREDDLIAATQLLIWEFVLGFRTYNPADGTSTLVDSTIYGKSILDRATQDPYNVLLGLMAQYKQTKMLQMDWTAKEFTQSILNNQIAEQDWTIAASSRSSYKNKGQLILFHNVLEPLAKPRMAHGSYFGVDAVDGTTVYNTSTDGMDGLVASAVGSLYAGQHIRNLKYRYAAYSDGKFNLSTFTKQGSSQFGSTATANGVSISGSNEYTGTFPSYATTYYTVPKVTTLNAEYSATHTTSKSTSTNAIYLPVVTPDVQTTIGLYSTSACTSMYNASSVPANKTVYVGNAIKNNSSCTVYVSVYDTNGNLVKNGSLDYFTLKAGESKVVCTGTVSTGAKGTTGTVRGGVLLEGYATSVSYGSDCSRVFFPIAFCWIYRHRLRLFVRSPCIGI